MARYEGGEQGLYPGTGVLINKLNIADQAELDAAEAAIVLLATFELSQRPLPEPPIGAGLSVFSQHPPRPVSGRLCLGRTDPR